MSTLGLFAAISLFYVLVGVHTLHLVIQRWGALRADVLEPEDARLASKAAFFLLIPPSVLLHELGHAVLVWAHGLEVVDFAFYGYMGYVVPSGRAGALGDFAISLAGNLVTLSIGLVALALGLFLPGRPFRNILLIDLGRQSLFIVLVFYPVICLAFPGDFVTIYDFLETPIASSLVAVGHALLLGPGYLGLWKRRWRPRALLLTSRHAVLFVQLERQLRERPEDLAARRQLGLLYLDAGRPEATRRLLAPLAASGQIDGHALLGLGLAELELRDHAAALAHLTSAEPRLMRPEARRLAVLGLGRASSELGRYEDAVARLGELELAELDEPALLAYTRSMAALGRGEELRVRIEAALAVKDSPNGPRLREALDELRRAKAP